MTTLPDGSVVVAGEFDGDLTIPGLEPLRDMDAGSDLFLAPFLPSDDADWARHIHVVGSGEASIESLSFANGRIVVVGIQNKKVRFEPEGFELHPTGMGASENGFIATYALDGSLAGDPLAFGSEQGGSSRLLVRAVSTLPNGDVAIGGSYDSNRGFSVGEPAIGTVDLPVGNGDCFLLVLRQQDVEGQLKWGAIWAATGVSQSAQANDIAPAPDGSMILTGEFLNNCLFGTTQLTTLTDSTDLANRDGFICRFSPTGQLEWARTAASQTPVIVNGVTHRFGDHPPRSQARHDFPARLVMRGAFAVPRGLGDPRAVPCFRCSFCLDVSPSLTPGTSPAACICALCASVVKKNDHRGAQVETGGGSPALPTASTAVAASTTRP